jgi:hypothetical protein
MEDFTARERRKRAIEAATAIALTYHIKSDTPTLLKDSNNTVIHLAPSPVVAKVATSIFQKQSVPNLEHELNVALHLTNSGAPIVPPSKELPPTVYHHGDLEITFWQYCPGEIRVEIDRSELAIVLKQFHTVFASYQGVLKSFIKDYKDCYLLLNSDRLSPELSTADHQFLHQVYEHLSESLYTFDYRCVPVHTEIHSENVMWVNNYPLLIDFESCCRGPLELDFLFFSEKNLLGCPDLDKQLMKILSHLKSLRVAVLCWTQPNRSPEVREAAKYHLRRLQSLY